MSYWLAISEEAARKKILETIPGWIGVVVALGVLGFAIVKIRDWVREGDDPADDLAEMLLVARELHREGDLSDEEFRKINQQTAARESRAD